MRRFLVPTLFALAAACSGPGDAPGAPREQASQSTNDGTAGPDISVTAAPGVAFDYRYSFRVPNDHIAAVQEQHAQACEQLGIARCRITGMRYQVIGEDDVRAMLAFKLQPSIARRFGKAGVDTVARAKGVLIDAEITGTDAGSAIAAAGRTAADRGVALGDVERKLAQRGLGDVERGQLSAETERLRQSIRAARADQAEQQASLATTPMTFDYGSDDLSGFDPPPVRDTVRRAAGNFVTGIAWLFVVVVTLLPWALAAGALWWIVCRFRRRFFGGA